MPALYGGADGGELTQRLLSLGFPRAMLIISGASRARGVAGLRSCCGALTPQCNSSAAQRNLQGSLVGPQRNAAVPTNSLVRTPQPRTPHAAFSNPVGVLRHAAAEGYVVEDFAAWPLPFGTYSSQPEVRACILGRGAAREQPLRAAQPPFARACCGDFLGAIGIPRSPPARPRAQASLSIPRPPSQVRSWIAEMKDRGEAFYSDAAGMYLIAGVLFRKRADAAGADVDAGAGADDANGGAAGQVPDLTKELLRVLTAL